MPTYYEPTCCCTTTATTNTGPMLSSLNITPTTITWASNNNEQKEYIEKLEKHIDELEEDIDFLDKMRQNMEGELAFHNEKISEFTTKISHLEDENTKLRDDLNNLYAKICIIQQILDNQ